MPWQSILILLIQEHSFNISTLFQYFKNEGNVEQINKQKYVIIFLIYTIAVNLTAYVYLIIIWLELLIFETLQ